MTYHAPPYFAASLFPNGRKLSSETTSLLCTNSLSDVEWTMLHAPTASIACLLPVSVGLVLRRLAFVSARCNAEVYSCLRASRGKDIATDGSDVRPLLPFTPGTSCRRTIREPGSAEATMADVAKYLFRRSPDLAPCDSRAAMRIAAVVDSSGEICERYALGSKMRSIEASISARVASPSTVVHHLGKAWRNKASTTTRINRRSAGNENKSVVRRAFIRSRVALKSCWMVQ
mmetsp:Transcript_2750/g.8474  ORF Transcript_2750/g.8474 Transcript_2750/m.8474 type:complete len:231 (-) Transcript_2750:1286-1978(-)